MNWALESLERVDGEGMPLPGDKIYVKCVGGYVLAIDPKTRKATDRKQAFILNEDMSLTILK